MNLTWTATGVNTWSGSADGKERQLTRFAIFQSSGDSPYQLWAYPPHSRSQWLVARDWHLDPLQKKAQETLLELHPMLALAEVKLGTGMPAEGPE